MNTAGQSNHSLKHFEVLIGRWTMVGTHPAFPSAVNGSSKFEWLVDGALLVWRFDWESPGPPSAVSVLGRDDGTETGVLLYSDVRGVARVCQMSLEAGIWRMWRDSPGFLQRMTGNFGDTGLIEVRGEKSSDGLAGNRTSP